mmetsp:Transcript_3455/g.3766  ORF Transcript_3455/g.3766 Transcript_3455/m.3766 type:complete len:228 (+) Transcript_3455:64-747(+)
MGKLTLICNPISPFDNRVLIALTYKGIDFDMKYYDHERDSEEVKKLNPTGNVPVLVLEDGTPIWESMAIIELLDLLPQYGDTPKLFPSDPVQRAQVYMKIARLDKFSARMGPYMMEGAEAALKGIDEGFQVFETVLGPDLFFGGENIGVVDVNIFPFVNRMYCCPEFVDVLAANKCVQGWYDRMLALPCIVQDIGKIQPEWWHMTIATYKAGKNPMLWPPKNLSSKK